MSRTVILLACLSIPCATRAEEPRERGNRLLREGNACHDRRDYACALERYRAARALYPSHRIDFNLALTYEALGRLPAAADHLERFIAAESRHKNPRMLQSARARLERLSRRLASVAVTSDTPRTRVWIDGELVGRTPLRNRVYLDPGEHHLRLTAEGRTAHERELTLEPGSRQDIVVALLPPLSAHRRETRGVRVRSPFYRKWWFWATVGGVVAAAGTAIGVAVSLRDRSPWLPQGELGTIP